MKIKHLCFLFLTLSVVESSYSQSALYLNHKVLTTPLVCDSASKRIILNNGAIDAIVTYSSMEMEAESPFTFIFLHSGKQIHRAGECIYHSPKPDAPFCILDPPCCAGNLRQYYWLQYNPQQDTIEQVWEVRVYTTTDIYSKNIVWHASPRQKKIQHIQLRSEPIENDTEEDYELRQIGNVICEIESKIVLVYELGYNKQQPAWRLYAIQRTDTRRTKSNYLIGWYKSHR